MNDSASEPKMPELRRRIPHYYGDSVRVFFVLGAVLILILLPFYPDDIFISTPAALIAIVIFTCAAGLTNPRHAWTWALNMIIASLAVILFGYSAILSYIKYSAFEPLFWANQALALNFLLALYFAIKTIRGMMVPDDRDKEEKKK